MINRKFDIFEFPTNLGLKAQYNVPEPGVRGLPEWLKKHGFHAQFAPENIFNLPPPLYSMNFDKETAVLNTKQVAQYAIDQSKIFGTQLTNENFKLIIGGDCSVLIGNSIALSQKGNYGLFFLDGHTDYIDTSISQTSAAGMDLAIVTGFGHDKLTNIFNLKPYFEEKNVFCVGNREYSNEYVKPILNSDIEYFSLEQLRAVGIRSITDSFLTRMNEKKWDGFFIHLDVDVLNDDIMPAVDSRQNDGLSYDELYKILYPLISDPKAVEIEISILDPDLDEQGTYTIEFIKQFGIIYSSIGNDLPKKNSIFFATTCN